jgi:CHAT domain-containing protein
MNSLSKIQVLIIFLFLQLPVAAQEIQPEIRQLRIGQTERKVTANEELHIYSIEMKRDQVLRVSVQEKGADVTAMIVRPSDQQKALAVSNYGSGFMQEYLTLIADQNGVYWLVISAQKVTEANIEAQYEFSTVLKSTADQNDVQRVKAQTLMEEGTRLLEGYDKTNSSPAITKFEESLKIWNVLGETYWAEIAKWSAANALFLAGNFSKSEFYFNQVLRAFTDSKNEPGIAAISLGLGGLYLVIRNDEAARRHLYKAFEISRRLGDKRAESLLGLAGITNLTSDNRDFAQDLAAARDKEDKLAEASVWAKTLFRYVIEDDSIDHEEQRTFFERAEREALPLLESVKNRDIELQIFLGLAIGFYDLTLGPDSDKAADLANQKKSINYICHAIVLARVQNNPIIQLFAYTHLNIFYDGDNDRLAIFFGKKVIDSLQDLKEDLKLVGKESLFDLAKRMDKGYNSVASDLFSEGRLGEAQQVLNLNRDQEFFDFSQEPAKLSLTPHEIENEQLFNSALESIAAKYSKRNDADYQLAGEELQVTLAKLEQNFSAPPSERDIVSNVPDTVDMQFALRELASKAGKKYAAIYVVEDVGKVLLIMPDGIFAFAGSRKSRELDKYILDFLQTLRSPYLDPRPLGARIYDKIFKTKELVNGKVTQTTLEEKLSRLKPDVLLWSLSGNIRYVPVAALYDANTGQYLVEKYQSAVFTRARKERFLIEPKTWKRGVGFGTSMAYGEYSSLPDVPNELSKIFGNAVTKQKGFFEGQVFLNRAFTRQAMRASLQSQPGFVHIASHFIFQPGDSRNSFLLLGDGSKFSLLEMYQTAGLFEGVDLLTLSACETAGQQSRADGKEVDGFAELAQRLGASSVIATLWTIADDGTSKFMTEFYRLRQANPKASKSEILQQAQLSLLKGNITTQSGGSPKRGGAEIVGLNQIPFKPRKSPLEHPYYWAPFVLFGSSR